MTKLQQITIKEFDQRFYLSEEGVYYPSVTHVLSCAYPNDPGLTKWIGSVGNEEAEKIRDEAGEMGSKVHGMIDRMIKGEKVENKDLKIKEKRALKAFSDWWKEQEPMVLSTEYQICNATEGYAGTVDLKCRLKEDDHKSIWLIDYKTSNSIHEKHKCQVAAYMAADEEVEKCALLHLANKTKKRFSFLEVDFDKYKKRFSYALIFFKELYPNAKPTEEAYPEFFSL